MATQRFATIDASTGHLVRMAQPPASHIPAAVDKAGDRPGKWHSQVGQDHLVHLLLGGKKGGFFIDLAANMPILISNSRSLERDHQWNGLCIEANPRFHPALMERRSCVVVGAAIAKEERETRFVNRGPFGGLLGNGFDNGNETRHSFAVRTVQFGRVLRELAVPPTIDYMSLDVEGAELEVMDSFPWRHHTISILSVERPKPALRELLVQHEYSHFCSTGHFGEELWMHSSVRARLPALPGAGVRCVDCEPLVMRCEPLLNPEWTCNNTWYMQRPAPGTCGIPLSAAPGDEL